MTRATVTIKTPEDRNRIATWARNVDDGTVVTFRKKSRSSEQSAKMWAMLHEVSEQVEWFGAKLDADDWKDVFTASLRHARVVPGIDKGTFVPLGMHTSTLTIEEMSNLIELIYAFGADADHPVVFKEPRVTESGSSVPSPEPVTAEDVPLASAASDSLSPELSDAPTNYQSALFPMDRADLIECCNKLMSIPVDKTLATPEAKRGVLVAAKDNWKVKLPSELHGHIKAFFESADAQIKGNADRAAALAVFAEMLECSVEEIGGAA